jgi:hypothetical protein
MVTETEIREARNEYARQWRAKNRDKVREANKRYWQKKTEQMKQDKDKNE